MPTLEWRGGGSTSAFNDKTNWIDQSTGATPTAAPANNDTLIFNQGSVNVPGATTGLTGITMIGTPGFSGTNGATTALDIDLASLDWDAGPLNLAGDITQGSVCCKSGAFSHSNGTVTDIYLENTDYNFASDSVVTALRAEGCNGSDEHNATGYTDIEIARGRHTTRRSAAPKLDASAKFKVAKKGELLDGTDIGGVSTLVYESSEDIALGVEVIVRPYSTFSARPSAGFAWPGELTEWKNAVVDLMTAAGAVVPATHKTFSRSQSAGSPIAI